MNKKKFNFSLRYISNNKLTGKMLTFHNYLFFNKIRHKINIKYISNLIFFFFFLKNLKLTNNKISFVVLPKRSKHFTLVKGPSGHKRGKHLFKFQYFNFALIFNKNYTCYLNDVNFSVLNAISFFHFIQKYFSHFSTNTIFLRKINFSLTCSLNFLNS